MVDFPDALPDGPAHTRRVLQQYFDNPAGLRPNLLLTGPPGCGKTTIATALARHYFLAHRGLAEVPPQSILYLNVASSVRGGDGITRHDCLLRNLICTQHPFCPHLLRFVVLDEVETLSVGAQRTLRELILLSRRLNSKLRFLLLSNFDWQILPALRRAVLALRVDPPSPDTVRERLLRTLWPAAGPGPSARDVVSVDLLARECQGDMRAAALRLQLRRARANSEANREDEEEEEEAGRRPA